MAQFYFNDCLPPLAQPTVDASNEFKLLMSKYFALLKDERYRIDNSIVLSRTVHESSVCGMNLAEMITKYSGSREIRSWMLALFSQAVILNNQWDDFVNDNLDKQFVFNGRDAWFLAMASARDLIPLSLPVEKELRCEELEIDVVDSQLQVKENVMRIDNWYGDGIAHLIRKIIPQPASKIDDLKMLFVDVGKTVSVSGDFEFQWNNVIKIESWKNRIIDRFKDAYNGGLLFPAKEGQNIVRKDSSGNTNVYELKLVDLAIRVYFYSDTNTIKILYYGTKSKHYGDGQSSDFRHAGEILKNMKE